MGSVDAPEIKIQVATNQMSLSPNWPKLAKIIKMKRQSIEIAKVTAAHLRKTRGREMMMLIEV